MHWPRIIGLAVLALVMISGSAAAADPVTVSGDVRLSNGDMTTEVDVDGSSTQLDLGADDNPADTIELTRPNGEDVTFEAHKESDVAINTDTFTQTTAEGGVKYKIKGTSLGSVTNPNVTINPALGNPITIAGGVSKFAYKRNTTVDQEVSGSDPDVNILLQYGSVDVDVQVGEPSDYANQDIMVWDYNGLGYVTNKSTNSNGRLSFTVGIDSGGRELRFETVKDPVVASVKPPDNSEVTTTDPKLNVTYGYPLGGAKTRYDIDWQIYNDSDGGSLISESQNAQFNASATGTFSNAVNGDNFWRIDLTHPSGRTITKKYQFFTPDTLKIYNESDPNQLLKDNIQHTVRFIDSKNNKIIERTTNDGEISLTGLDRDTRYIVTVRPENNDNYVFRRVIVDDLGEGESVYLLKDSASTSEVKFELDDPGGQFPPRETELYIEKPITRDFDGDGSNETRYEVVAGDVFGSSGQFPMIVQNGVRYRLRVETRDGSTSRVLGAYSTNSPERVPLTIERIAPSGNVDGGRVVQGGVEGDQVVIRYLDATSSTDTVEYNVINESGTKVVPNTTRNDNRFADFYDLPGGQNATYTVQWTITAENGNVTSGSFEAGRVVDGVSERLDADANWLELLSYVAIIASMGLVVLVSAQLAPLTGTAVASLLTVLGTVGIPAPILAIAGAISILLPLGRR